MLALCACSSFMASAQDSIKVRSEKRNSIAVKPFECVNNYMLSHFARATSNVYNYYGFGLAYGRSLRPGSRWSIVLPVNVRQNLNHNEGATAVFFYPGIKYDIIRQGRLHYAVSLHAGAGRESGQRIARDIDGHYSLNNRFRNLSCFSAINHSLSVPLTSSLSIGLDAGLSFGIVDLFQDKGPYSINQSWQVSYGPYAMVNGGIALNYTF